MATETPDAAPDYMDYAGRALRTAQLNLDDDDWVGSINRSYYAVFYAANALLSLDHEQRSKHSHVMALFRQKYVKTGLIEKEYSDIYGEAFDNRIESDYDLLEPPTRKLAEDMLQKAQRFVERIQRLLAEKA
jgi:uncharacterized protein (UPF0332 family)